MSHVWLSTPNCLEVLLCVAYKTQWSCWKKEKRNGVGEGEAGEVKW